MINKPSLGEPVVDENGKAARSWWAWFDEITFLVGLSQQHGTTANRPTARLFIGRQYFDDTLGYPIWWDGTAWVKYDGTAA